MLALIFKGDETGGGIEANWVVYFYLLWTSHEVERQQGRSVFCVASFSRSATWQ